MENLSDKDNLNTDYRFILDNLDILTADIDIWNIGKQFPERKKVSIMQNQNLINFVRRIKRDIKEGNNDFIYFNAHQWSTIVNKLRETEAVI